MGGGGERNVESGTWKVEMRRLETGERRRRAREVKRGETTLAEWRVVAEEEGAGAWSCMRARGRGCAQGRGRGLWCEEARWVRDGGGHRGLRATLGGMMMRKTCRYDGRGALMPGRTPTSVALQEFNATPAISWRHIWLGNVPSIGQERGVRITHISRAHIFRSVTLLLCIVTLIVIMSLRSPATLRVATMHQAAGYIVFIGVPLIISSLPLYRRSHASIWAHVPAWCISVLTFVAWGAYYPWLAGAPVIGMFAVPMCLTVLATILTLAGTFASAMHMKRTRLREGRCVQCGYPISAMTDTRCSECGELWRRRNTR